MLCDLAELAAIEAIEAIEAKSIDRVPLKLKATQIA